MHRALAIVEILAAIFGLLERDSNARNARVCKVWSDEALDNAWTEVKPGVFRSLAPMEVSGLSDDGTKLLVCLTLQWAKIAKELTVSLLCKSFTRPVTAHDWQRFLLNSARVREWFDSSFLSKYRLSPEALGEIRLTCPTVNIFPHLRVISAGTSELEPLLISNSVEVLYLLFNYDDSHTDSLSTRIRSVIDNIRGHMPALHTLTIACDEQIPDVDDELLSLLKCVSEIKHLELPPRCFNASIAQIISCFKNLQVVAMDTNDPIIPWPCTALSLCSADKWLGPNAFPSLHELEFSSCNIEDAWVFLSQPAFPFRDLKTLFIHTTTIPAPARIQALLESFNSTCTALTTLTLSFHEFEYRDGNNLLLTPRLNIQHLNPFVYSRTLTSFAFRHPYPIEMTDQDASEIATHCQRFKTLLLNPHPVVTTPTSLTLKALMTFITGCPHLRELGLYLDASVYIPPVVPLHASVPHPLRIDLYLGRSRLPIASISPLMAYTSIAEFCASILSPSCVWVWPKDDDFYPELKNAWWWLGGLGGHDDLMEYESGWKTVASMTEAIFQERGL